MILEVFVGPIVLSLCQVGLVFGVATFVSAVFSKPSSAGHLAPKLSSTFQTIALIGCILLFPIHANFFGLQVKYPGHLVDACITNAVVVCVIWICILQSRQKRYFENITNGKDQS